MANMFEEAGKKGGEARAKNLTPEERSEAARNAVQARWVRLGMWPPHYRRWRRLRAER